MKKLVLAALVLLFIAGFAVGQDLSALKKKINKAAENGDWTTFCSGVKELGSVDTVDSVKFIMRVAFGLDKSNVADSVKADSFDAAMSALKQISDEEALTYIREQLLRNRKWQVRRLLAEVLGEKGGEKDRQVLCDLIGKERKTEVIREAVKWIVKIGGTDSMEALIDVLAKLERSKGLAWVDVRRALTSLTGADKESALKWSEYWRCRKEELKAGDKSPDTASPVAPGDVKTGLLEEEIKKAPKFFGKEILSKRFCFVIDVSGSMAEKDTYSGGGGGEAGGKGQPVESTRIEMVKEQLIKLIAALDPKTRFNIIAYSMGVSPWQKQKLVAAGSKAKKAAIEFVKRFNPAGTTHTDRALKEAFANKEADTIVLLTDGAPTHSGRYDDSSNLISSIFDFVRNANKSRKVTIDTFGFESVTSKHQAQNMGQAFLDFLKRLASENNGKFTNIR
jgi:hypothetical protein